MFFNKHSIQVSLYNWPYNNGRTHYTGLFINPWNILKIRNK